MSRFDVDAIRRRFPALAIEDGGRPIALFDGPGGTQVPSSVIDAVDPYYRTSNANHGGPFLMERLGLLDRDLVVRIGLTHYNTVAEVDRLLEALGRIASGAGLARPATAAAG